MKPYKEPTRRQRILQDNYFHVNNGGLTVSLEERESLNDDNIPEYISYYLQFRHSHFSFQNKYELRVDDEKFLDYMIYVCRYLKNRINERREDYDGITAGKKEVAELEQMIETGQYSKEIKDICKFNGEAMKKCAERLIKMKKNPKKHYKENIFRSPDWKIKDGLKIKKEYMEYIKDEYTSYSVISKIKYYDAETDEFIKEEILKIDPDNIEKKQIESVSGGGMNEYFKEDVGKLLTPEEHRKLKHPKDKSGNGFSFHVKK